MKRRTKKLLALTAFGLGMLVSAGCGGGGGSDNNDSVRQRDRMGMPGVNTALISPAEKDNFNFGDPSTDNSDFRQLMLDNIRAVRAAVAAVPGFPPEDSPGVTPEQVVALVSPDVLHIDLGQPSGFPNGRRLTDDTINPTLGLVLNRGNVLGGGPGVSDAIDTPKTTIPTFPYGAQPNPK